MEIKFKVLCPAGYQVDDISNDNIDINIIVNDGNVYFGTLFTISNIISLMEGSIEPYFWSTDLLIVKDLSIHTILFSIDSIIRESSLEMVFSNIGRIEDIYPNKIDFESITEYFGSDI